MLHCISSSCYLGGKKIQSFNMQKLKSEEEIQDKKTKTPLTTLNIIRLIIYINSAALKSLTELKLKAHKARAHREVRFIVSNIILEASPKCIYV